MAEENGGDQTGGSKLAKFVGAVEQYFRGMPDRFKNDAPEDPLDARLRSVRESLSHLPLQQQNGHRKPQPPQR